MTEHHIITQRSARYYTIGTITRETQRVWLACHGYAQLAGEFIKLLEPLKDDHSVIVAPEALSRFYTKGFFGAVGATWMTREDRVAEIEDYVFYLQALFEKIRNSASSNTEIHVLGFSQGCSTVSRWVAQKGPDIKCLWLCSGSIPDDLNFSAFKEATHKYPVRFIIGTEDTLISQNDRDAVLNRINRHGLKVEIHTFTGGHELNLPLIQSLL